VSSLEFVELLGCRGCRSSNLGGLGPLFLQRFFLSLSLSPVIGLPLCVYQVVGGVSLVPEALFFFFFLFSVPQNGPIDLSSGSQILSFAN